MLCANEKTTKDHKYRAYNLNVLTEAETVLRLLETLQIALAENPHVEITKSISGMFFCSLIIS